jgi:hypothetical protein
VLVALLIAGVGVAGAVAATLAFLLWRSRQRAADTTGLIADATARIRVAVEEETAAHADEIRRLLARERAESMSALAAEERRLGEERRAAFAERERVTSDGLADSLARVERRLEDRLQAFSDDLDRAQRHLGQQIESLEQRRRQALADMQHRIDAEAAELGSTADEQRRVVLRLREELERAAGQAVTEALDQLEAQTVERRRVIDEITERLRLRESAIAESIEKAENDLRARIDVMVIGWEQRQTERLERVTEREIERHVGMATQAFDERLREIREEAVSALSRELDRTVDVLTREGLVRRLEE